MAKVTIYTRPMCGFCARALKLLDRKGADFEEIPAGMDPDKRAEMIQRANGATTYPQIFIGETHVGGCDDLFELDYDGKLNAMLEA